MSSSHLIIVGSGPAGLMAASIASKAGVRVSLVEKRKAPGRKLLIAGSSGLNITNALPPKEFAKGYSGSAPARFWDETLEEFSPSAWIEFLEKELGQETFLGTSSRYFVREMKASKLLRAWLHSLDKNGVTLISNQECVDFEAGAVTLSDGSRIVGDAILFALGGASYEPDEEPLRWEKIFRNKGIRATPFTPSNVGHHVPWSEGLLREAEGKPIKNCTLTTRRGSKRGELVITRYGLEGTPVYTVGALGEARLNLFPERSHSELLSRCVAIRENLAPIRRIKKQLGLSEAALALIFHETPKPLLQDLRKLLDRLQSFPIRFTGTQPLSEAISSSGGIDFDQMDSKTLELRNTPGVFCAGEMLDWDAPTGGFLIQGAVSTGYRAALGILRRLKIPSHP